MIIIQNCRNPECLAKKSMIPIITKKNNSVKSYHTHSNRTAFYICSKCGFMGGYRLKDIQEDGIFSICLVSSDDEDKIDKIKNMNNPSCVYCGISAFPPIPEKDVKQEKNIIKLWLQDNFFGYYCKVHRLAFCKKIEGVNWTNIPWKFQGTGRINVLEPLNNLTSRYIHKDYKKDKNGKFILNKEHKKIIISVLKLTKDTIPEIGLKSEKFDENQGLLIDYVEFQKILGGNTTSAPLEPSSNFQQVSVNIPQNKMNKFKKWLEQNDCNIT